MSELLQLLHLLQPLPAAAKMPGKIGKNELLHFLHFLRLGLPKGSSCGHSRGRRKKCKKCNNSFSLVFWAVFAESQPRAPTTINAINLFFFAFSSASDGRTIVCGQRVATTGGNRLPTRYRQKKFSVCPAPSPAARLMSAGYRDRLSSPDSGVCEPQ